MIGACVFSVTCVVCWCDQSMVAFHCCCAELQGRQGRGGVRNVRTWNAKFEADFRWDKGSDPSQEKRELKAGKHAVCLETNELLKSRTPCRHQKRKEGPWERVPVCGPQGGGGLFDRSRAVGCTSYLLPQDKVAAFKEQGWGGDSGCGESPGFRQLPRGVNKCCDRRRENMSGTWGRISPRACGKTSPSCE